jgi:hypothetical protein
MSSMSSSAGGVGPGLAPHRVQHRAVDALVGEVALRRLLPRDQGAHEVGTAGEAEHPPALVYDRRGEQLSLDEVERIAL